MAEGAYWGYWKHKIEQMWKEIEDLKQRVVELESEKVSRNQKFPSSQPIEKPFLVPVKVEGQARISPPMPLVKSVGHETPVIAILKKSSPMNIVDINSILVEQGIHESVRDTLFNRVKVLMKKGKVNYDEKTQRFFVGCSCSEWSIY